MSSEPADRSRKGAILAAARPVFLRYGYRKTSMDDVAKAADVSRQGLYVHFASKEDLFREMIHHGLALHVQEAVTVLADESRPIARRLVVALNEWFGDRDQIGPGSDLPQASMQMAGDAIRDNKRRLDEAVCRAIATSELMPFYEQRAISATDVTTTLLAIAQGLNGTPSSETFEARLEAAVKVLTAPSAVGRMSAA